MKLYAFAALAALPMLASAQALHQTADGKRLDIGMSCAKTISVAADPGLTDHVVLDATASHPEELAQMEFAGGAAVHLKLRRLTVPLHGECWRPEPAGASSPRWR